MLGLTLTPDLALNPWDHLQHVEAVGEVVAIGRLPGGMKSGESSVAIHVKALGQDIIVETSMKLFVSAAAKLVQVEQAQATPPYLR